MSITYYLVDKKKVCHFYQDCKKLKKIEPREIDSELFAREYICKTNNHYEICSECSRRNMLELIGCVCGVIFAMGIIARSFKTKEEIDKEIRGCKIWIESPEGRQYHIPHYQALRIVRKRHWQLTEVSPEQSISIKAKKLYYYLNGKASRCLVPRSAQR